MCILLCANTSVREWFDKPAALDYRRSLQMNGPLIGDHAVPDTPSLGQHEPNALSAQREAPNPLTLRCMKRPAWLQAYCHYRSALAPHERGRALCGRSSSDWPKALEAIAKTWGRLLSFVGLRR
jgi:hypothetical protein